MNIFRSMLKLIKFLRYYIYRAYNIIVDLFKLGKDNIVDLFTYLELFQTYFQTALCWVYMF